MDISEENEKVNDAPVKVTADHNQSHDRAGKNAEILSSCHDDSKNNNCHGKQDDDKQTHDITQDHMSDGQNSGCQDTDRKRRENITDCGEQKEDNKAILLGGSELEPANGHASSKESSVIDDSKEVGTTQSENSISEEVATEEIDEKLRNEHVCDKQNENAVNQCNMQTNEDGLRPEENGSKDSVNNVKPNEGTVNLLEIQSSGDVMRPEDNYCTDSMITTTSSTGDVGRGEVDENQVGEVQTKADTVEQRCNGDLDTNVAEQRAEGVGDIDKVNAEKYRDRGESVEETKDCAEIVKETDTMVCTEPNMVNGEKLGSNTQDFGTICSETDMVDGENMVPNTAGVKTLENTKLGSCESSSEIKTILDGKVEESGCGNSELDGRTTILDCTTSDSDKKKDNAHIQTSDLVNKSGDEESLVGVVMREKGGRKEEEKTPVSVEFQFEVFGKMQEKAEQRLAQRRQAREEARQIRMRELEKQQKEMEEKQDRIYELTKDSATSRSYQGSRRGSDDSTSSEDTRELKKQLAEMEEKYKKAMMNNAQLDNEKQTYRYEVDQMKDEFVELEENYIESQRLLKERCRELEQKRRENEDLLTESEFHKTQVTERDKLIQEYGLVFISNDSVEDEDDKKTTKRRRKKKEEEEQKPALVTRDALQILASVDGSLDEKVKKLSEENKNLENVLKKLRLQLEEETAKNAIAEKFNSPKQSKKESTSNGPIDNITTETNSEAQKQLTEYRYKLKKAEQDITVLEGNVIRLESQVKRYKSTADESEKAIEEMKSEKRKVQREMRESQNQIAELESQNNHLQKRLEKFKKERMDAIISGKS